MQAGGRTFRIAGGWYAVSTLVVVAALHIDAVSAGLERACITRRGIDVDLQRTPPAAARAGVIISPIGLLAESARRVASRCMRADAGAKVDTA